VGLGFSCTVMEIFVKDTLRMDFYLKEVNILGLMGINMKAIGLKARKQATVYLCVQIEIVIWVTGMRIR